MLDLRRPDLAAADRGRARPRRLVAVAGLRADRGAGPVRPLLRGAGRPRARPLAAGHPPGPGWRGIAAGGSRWLLAAAPIPLIIVGIRRRARLDSTPDLPRFYGAVVELTGSRACSGPGRAAGGRRACCAASDPRIWLLIAASCCRSPGWRSCRCSSRSSFLAIDHGAAHAGDPRRRGRGGAPRPAVGGPVAAAVRWPLVLALRVRLLERDPSTGARRPLDRRRCAAGRSCGDAVGFARRWSTTCIAHSPTDRARGDKLRPGSVRQGGSGLAGADGKRRARSANRAALPRSLPRHRRTNLAARGRLFLLEPIDDATSAVSSPIGRLLIRSRGSSQPGRIR